MHDHELSTVDDIVKALVQLMIAHMRLRHEREQSQRRQDELEKFLAAFKEDFGESVKGALEDEKLALRDLRLNAKTDEEYAAGVAKRQRDFDKNHRSRAMDLVNQHGPLLASYPGGLMRLQTEVRGECKERLAEYESFKTCKAACLDPDLNETDIRELAKRKSPMHEKALTRACEIGSGDKLLAQALVMRSDLKPHHSEKLRCCGDQVVDQVLLEQSKDKDLIYRVLTESSYRQGSGHEACSVDLRKAAMRNPLMKDDEFKARLIASGQAEWLKAPEESKTTKVDPTQAPAQENNVDSQLDSVASDSGAGGNSSAALGSDNTLSEEPHKEPTATLVPQLSLASFGNQRSPLDVEKMSEEEFNNRLDKMNADLESGELTDESIEFMNVFAEMIDKKSERSRSASGVETVVSSEGEIAAEAEDEIVSAETPENQENASEVESASESGVKMT